MKTHRASQRLTVVVFNRRMRQRCAVSFTPQPLYLRGTKPQYPLHRKLKIYVKQRYTWIFGERPTVHKVIKQYIVHTYTTEVTYSPSRVSSRWASGMWGSCISTVFRGGCGSTYPLVTNHLLSSCEQICWSVSVCCTCINTSVRHNRQNTRAFDVRFDFTFNKHVLNLRLNSARNHELRKTHLYTKLNNATNKVHIHKY